MALPRQEQTAPVTASTPEAEPTFRIQAKQDLVLVRVVVRDSKGRLVGILHARDFKITDNRREQAISHFAVETASSDEPAAVDAGKPGGVTSHLQPSALVAPQRFIGLFFDDLHSSPGDLVRTRKAADRYLASLRPEDRAAISSVSGKVRLDFTHDPEKLSSAVGRLQAQASLGKEPNPCPSLSDYGAYQIIERDDPLALQLYARETLQCGNLPPDGMRAAIAVTRARSREMLDRGTREAQDVLGALKQFVRYVSTRPGQRSIVLASPGFFTTTLQQSLDELIDEALLAGVVIHSLDPEGLNTLPMADASTPSSVLNEDTELTGQHERYAEETVHEHRAALADLASATGGEFFHDNNDLEAGFRRLSALADVYYVLAFSPTHLEPEGSFHQLRVSLAHPGGLTIQARKGYFAPKAPTALRAVAGDEIHQAILASDEIRDIPNHMYMRYTKLTTAEGRLSVWTNLEIQSLHLRTEGGLSHDHLDVAVVLFDQDGKEVTGQEKHLDLNLSSQDLDRFKKSGLPVEVDLQAVPGEYTLREVVREQAGLMSAMSRHVHLTL